MTRSPAWSSSRRLELASCSAAVALPGQQVGGIGVESGSDLTEPLELRTRAASHDLPEVASADTGMVGQVRDGEFLAASPLADVLDQSPVQLVHGRLARGTVGSVRRGGVRLTGLR